MKTKITVHYEVGDSVEKEEMETIGRTIVQVLPGNIGRVRTPNNVYLYSNVVRIHREETP